MKKIIKANEGGYFQAGYGRGFKKNKPIYKHNDKFYVKDMVNAETTFEQDTFTELGFIEVKPIIINNKTTYHA